MKIKTISIKQVSIPLLKPFKTALRTVFTLDSIIVIIQTNSNIIGYGETAPTKAITGETKESIINAIKFLEPYIINKDIEDFNVLLNTIHTTLKNNFSAKSALEIALYDIISQKSKMPLYKYLGGKKRNFTTNITISLNDIDTMIKDSHEAIELGFKSLKIKLGDNYKEDIKRIYEIHKAIGKNISLKLDANQGWNAKQSVKFLNAIEEKNINIDLIEQPVKRYDIKGLKYIKQRTSIPIMADESAFNVKDTIKLLEQNAVDIINIKLDKCGGISKAMQIADICQVYNKKCMIGCMLEGAISVGAAAHVASAKSNIITFYDLDAPMLCKNNVIKKGVKFNAPNIKLSNNFGLGITGLKFM